MELALIACVVFGAALGFKLGYSKGVKVNRPVAEPKQPTPYDERLDRR